jgi:TolB protein
MTNASKFSGFTAMAWLVAAASRAATPTLEFGMVEHFAPGIASTDASEVRLTLSPDGNTALWFSRNRPGGAGGYDIWMSRRERGAWQAATPVSFNSPGRDFDPAFSADGRYVYFCSDRAATLGGDDIWRVPVTRAGFGEVEHLGPAINSAANEWAPMLSPDGGSLLISSNREGGKGRMDLYVSRLENKVFTPAKPVAGALNTADDEFDATFLDDGVTIVYSRAPNLTKDLYVSGATNGNYEPGVPLPSSINDGKNDTYGVMLDWSQPRTLTISGPRADAKSVDLFRVEYRATRRD